MTKDFYKILGVDKGADEAALKAAYRKKALEFHPDRNPGNQEAEAKFKEVNEAYDVLRDPQKRAAYDRFGSAAFEQGGGRGPGGFGAAGGNPFEGFQQGGFEGNFDDLFEDLMGGLFGQGFGGGPQTKRSRAARGADLRYNLEVTLAQVVSGTKAKISYPTTQSCRTCDGSGAKKGTKPTTCGTCQGQGTVFMRQGFFQMSRTCPDCSGTGQIIKEKCADCHGAGRTRTTRHLEVTVPVGVDEGTRLRLAGEGEAGTGGAPSGDLFVFISVAKHPLFQRDGLNLELTVPVGMLDAALGTEVELPLLNGDKTTLKIPPGTQPGERVRLHGLGLPALGRPRDCGDLVAQIQVEIPTNLSKAQKEQLATLQAALKPGRAQEGFASRLRKLFG
ncbi:MAG: molecular chaperone DnaJ [Alphaproteobacteria bacterium]|nr:molecular chaperone DnaJ [Alphaproteobacteria bacterium]